MKKNSDNIKDNDTIEAIVGEVLTEQEAEEKKLPSPRETTET